MREMTDEDYSNFLLASTLAGMAIAQTGTTIPHSLSYAITYELGVPHGIAIRYFCRDIFVRQMQQIRSICYQQLDLLQWMNLQISFRW